MSLGPCCSASRYPSLTHARAHTQAHARNRYLLMPVKPANPPTHIHPLLVPLPHSPPPPRSLTRHQATCSRGPVFGLLISLLVALDYILWSALSYWWPEDDIQTAGARPRLCVRVRCNFVAGGIELECCVCVVCCSSAAPVEPCSLRAAGTLTLPPSAPHPLPSPLAPFPHLSPQWTTQTRGGVRARARRRRAGGQRASKASGPRARPRLSPTCSQLLQQLRRRMTCPGASLYLYLSLPQQPPLGSLPPLRLREEGLQVRRA